MVWCYYQFSIFAVFDVSLVITTLHYATNWRDKLRTFLHLLNNNKHKH